MSSNYLGIITNNFDTFKSDIFIKYYNKYERQSFVGSFNYSMRIGMAMEAENMYYYINLRKLRFSDGYSHDRL